MSNGRQAWFIEWLKSGLLEVQEYVKLCVAAARGTVSRPFYARDVMEQIDIIGLGSLTVVVLTGFFTGAVLALQSGMTLDQFGARPFVGRLISASMIKELGPVLTALMLAGRVGSGIAAELGSMVVTEQISALRALGTDPIRKLVVPRVLASTMMFPVVVAVAMLVGLLSGWVASLGLLDITTPQFLKGARIFFTDFDVRYGLVKSASFGAAVALIGCRAGLNTQGGAQGVGRGATRAVVISAVMILVLDAFWALVWLSGRTLR